RDRNTAVPNCANPVPFLVTVLFDARAVPFDSTAIPSFKLCTLAARRSRIVISLPAVGAMKDPLLRILILARYFGGKGVIVPELSWLLPSTVLSPRERNTPEPPPTSPTSLPVTVLFDARTALLSEAM